MSLSPKVQTQLAAWADAFRAFVPHLLGEPADVTLDDARNAYVRFLATNLPPDGVSIAQCDMGGVSGTVVTPDGVESGRSSPVLFYIHGGGYFSGRPAGYHGIAGRYAKLLNSKVYMPDYRLAPEHPFPTPIDDTLSAYRWLLETGHDPRRIVFSGDSAGGAMVVSVMVKARNAGLPLPAAGAALSPWANLEHTGASMGSRAGLDPLVNKEALDGIASMFLAGTLRNDPDASPVFADVRGLPPILIQAGENEVMLSDAMRLAQHLAENRIRTSLEVWPGMFHVWHLFADILPDAQQALENASTFLKNALPRTS